MNREGAGPALSPSAFGARFAHLRETRMTHGFGAEKVVIVSIITVGHGQGGQSAIGVQGAHAFNSCSQKHKRACIRNYGSTKL